MGKVYCSVCKRKCKGDVLKLDKKFIHKECFNCHKCGQNLEKGGFFQRDNFYYCSEDYQKLFGVKCGICNKYADGEVVTIFGGTFHIQCFQCQSCSHPFRCGDKSTLWDGLYLCDHCAGERQEKENVSPSSSDHKSTPGSDFIVPSSEKTLESAIVAQSMVAAPYLDSSDTEGPLQPQQYLQLHIDNGYTSTDSGVEKTKSEMGCLSPCYSTSSGDESWMKSFKARKSKTLNYFQFGKCLNQSYLTIEKRMSERTPANARYRAMVNSISPDPKYAHFHRPDNFSYRSQPNINSKRGMSLLVNPVSPNFNNRMFMATSPKVTVPMNGQNFNHQTNGDVDLTEEVKRLAHFPDGKEPDSRCDPPIDRYDFPAPPFANMVYQDFKRERSSRGRAVVSTGDIFYDTCSGTDTAMEMSDFGESEDERIRKEKVQRRIHELKSTGKYSGLSQSLLDDLEKRTTEKSAVIVDPVSSSRSPDASFEPSYKTRYERHTFTSPSRDSRYEGRAMHQLQSKMQYTSTGGRTGTMSGYTSNVENDSAARSLHSYRSYNPALQPGFVQGYMSCGEGPPHGRPISSLSYRASSLPRPLNIYAAQTSMIHAAYMMDNHMSPSMTTSGYSVDATTHSIDESTLIGGSGILHVQRDGYMSDMAPCSAIPQSKKGRPDWFYESDNDAILHSNYPTVQSYLKPSNMLRAKEKIPAQVIPYEILKISNFSLPKGLDRTKLEIYLSDTDFHMVFHMSRQAFARLPEWKRNDLKQKMDLY